MYCINPECKQRQNSDDVESCQACGTPLRIRDRYRLIRPLRELNPRYSTEVFEIDDRGERKVMKILKSDRGDSVKRFEREAFVLQLLNHSGIPKVDLDGYFVVAAHHCSEYLNCIVMEKIDGLTLEEWVERYGKISQKLALNWLKQLLAILDLLHRENFFHRDIKPSNIICKPDGQLVLIDFGSVREMTDTYTIKLTRSVRSKTLESSITTVVSGGYTPQEQIDGKAMPQSDFFALGRTFVYLLTGIQPTELPKNPKNGQLIWRDKAPRISFPLADFIDELMAPLFKDRPQDTQDIKIPTTRSLFIRKIEHFLKSPRFIMTAITTLSLIGILYRLSFPWLGQYYYDRGLEAHKANKLDLALQNYEQAKKFNDRDSRIPNNIGLICKEQKNLGCAEENFKNALKIEQDSGTLYNLGQVYELMEALDRAEEQYKTAIALDGDTIDYSLNSLSRLYILKENLPRAIELSERGLKETRKPKVKAALYRNLGWIDWIQGDYTKAEDNLHKALELQSDRTDAYCLLALVRESQGKMNEGLKEWKLCRDGDAKDRVEVLVWQTMARQRLLKAEKKP